MAELELSESEQYRFDDSIRGYGVEIYGGTPEDRIQVLLDRLNDPIVVDCRTVVSADEFIEEALRELGVSEEIIQKSASLQIDLRQRLEETQRSLLIAEFDSLPNSEQTPLAQTMKGIAEGLLESDSIMFGYTCNDAGSVVSAEHDLSIRVQNWGVD